MFEKPKDIFGECNARLFLGDDYGDGTCTIKCNLHEKHLGKHEEKFNRDDDEVIISWKNDEREVSLICTIDSTVPDKIDAILESVYPHGYIWTDDLLPQVEIRCKLTNVDKISQLPGIISIENKGFVND